jgi:AbiV family abortive infection protein
MARKQHLPPDLSPAQVIALQNALLANANRLLEAALAMLDADNVPLARSLAILGMEESGKAIAMHERRGRMAHAPEGQPFVNDRLKDLWSQHTLKLEAVHDFLAREDYWFGEGPSDPLENERVLGTIGEWKKHHNELKQRGFYVDVTDQGDPVTPQGAADTDAVRTVIGHVHQIGWQLRLGEHIEGKKRLEHEQDVPPATDEEIDSMRALMRSVDPELGEKIIKSMREGMTGTKLNNAAYAFVLPENPFENVRRPGYEAQDRELLALMEEISQRRGQDADKDVER